MSHGAAFRYLGWQVRDRLVGRVLACVVISAALLLPAAVTAHGPGLTPARAEAMLTSFFRQFISVFALVIAAGIIAQDRAQRWYTFYFAKPVSPLWYYAQAIALSFAGMVVSCLAFQGIFYAMVFPIWRWGLLAEGLVMFSLTGMLVVAWSAWTRYDWIAAIVTLMVIGGIRSAFVDRPAEGLVRALLPPTHLTGRSLSALEYAWVGAWAVVLLGVTLVTLRRRPAGEG